MVAREGRVGLASRLGLNNGHVLIIVIQQTMTSALMTQAWPYHFCQELMPFVAHDGGPCTCYQRFR